MDQVAGAERWAGASREWAEEPFARVFHLHYGRVVGIAARIVADRALAEEIADDAFWKLYRQPQLQAEGNNVAGWLFRTATRLGLDALRKRRRRSGGEDRLHREAPAECRPGPLGSLVRREEIERVQAALRALKPVQAQALVLRHSGMSYAEIAAALAMKPTSVGTTLARAEAAFCRQVQKGRKP